MVTKKEILIVGAGASGLPSIRFALLNNVTPICFEASNDIGGLWRYKPNETEESSVMKSTVINSSKETTAYSDFPPPAEAANFMHNRELLKYLRAYATEYGLNQYIHLNHRVINIRRGDNYKNDGKWNVKYINNKDEEKEKIFDGVLVCSGHHTYPYFPEPWEGQEKFKGKIIHSHSYKDHKGYEDQVVVVVGIGNSGGDIAVELSRVAKKVYLVTRRGTWIFNRLYTYGVPVEFAFSRRIDFMLRPIFPLWLSNLVIEKKMHERVDHVTYGLMPKHNVLSAHPTVNDELPNRLANGTVVIKQNVKSFNERDVIFEDNSIVKNVDTVILSTGYKFDFKLIEEGKLIHVANNSVNLYKYMYPPELSDMNTLAIIGLIQPYGSIMPISELQARIYFEVLSGNVKLPMEHEMMEDIIKKKNEMAARYVESQRHTIQVDGPVFMDELGDLIGCTPKPFKFLFSDFKLFKALVFGPNVSYAYRIEGNHPYEGARKALVEMDYRVKYPTSYNRPIKENMLSRSYLLKLFGSLEPVFILIGIVSLIRLFLQLVY
uniref:Flavin-containing monooxygenase n=1 Tax=Parastrongyloides trichosuri TaxID=131310 RepID=A0A0N4ZM36_PARTI